MFFENESSLESKVELVDKIFLYSSSKKNDSIKKEKYINYLNIILKLMIRIFISYTFLGYMSNIR